MKNEIKKQKSRTQLKSILMIFLMLASMLTVVINPTVKADTYADVYVDDDAASGWYNATHVKTVQEGITNVSVGGTIHVWAGTYGVVAVNKEVTIQGNGTANTILTSAGDAVVLISVSNVTMRGLRVTGSATHGIRLWSSGTTNNILLEELLIDEIIATSGNAIRIHGSGGSAFTDNLTINNVEIKHCTVGLNVDWDAGLITVNNSYIHNCTGSGFYDDQNIDDLIIENTTFAYNCRTPTHTVPDVCIAYLSKNGNITMDTVTVISNGTEAGIRISGYKTGSSGSYVVYPAGIWSITDLTITGIQQSLGSYPSGALVITRFADMSNVAFNNVDLSSTAPNGLFLGTVTGDDLDINDMDFSGGTFNQSIRLGRHGNSATYAKATIDVDATGATFGTTDYESIIYHQVDDAELGLVSFPVSYSSLAISPPTRMVEVGQTFTVNVTVNLSEIIDTVATDEITFTSGKLSCNNVTQGNLFVDSTFWLDGTISNSSGNITDICWGSHTPTTSPGTFITLSFTALAPGMAYINITASKITVAYNMTARVTNITSNGTITIQLYVPEIPTGFDATAHNRTQIDLTWTKGDRADSTYIVAKKDSYPTDRDDGTNIYNGSEASKEHTGLAPNENWYYRAWSWNETGGKFSTTYAQDDATTTVNRGPAFSSEYPTNETTGVDISLNEVSVYVGDLDGDKLNVTVSFPGSGSDNWRNASANDTFSTDVVAPLDFDTIYYWYVNVFDGYDWSNVTYHFTTRSAYVPAVPTGFNAQKYNRTQINLTWTKGAGADYTYIEWNTSAGPWAIGEGDLLYNGTTGSEEHTGLSPGIRYYYQAWSYNATDNVFSASYSSDNDKTGENNAPELTDETPTNDSIGIDVEYSTAYITIGDKENELMDWMIHGQYLTTASGSGSGNTTHQASFITPLPYDAVIYWYVNVTDGFNWTNATYHFTTRDIYEPVAPGAFTATTIDRFEIDLAWTPTDDGTYIEYSLTPGPWSRGAGIPLYGGAGSDYPHTGLDEGTPYYYQAWSYNITDDVYSLLFASTSNTTVYDLQPILSNEDPYDTEIDVDIWYSVNVDVFDPESDLMDWTIEASNGDSNGNTGAGNGQIGCPLTTPLNYGETIYWYVNVTDGMEWTRDVYSFTVRSEYTPGVPTSFTATAYGTSQINMTWSKGSMADKTYVERYSSQTWVMGTGTPIYNNTGVRFEDTGRSAHTTYFYQAWSWNTSDNTFSITYSEANGTTLNNLPNQPTNERPVNNTPYTTVYRKYLNVTVSDPDGDALTVYFKWQNGTTIGYTTVASGAVASIYLPTYINPDWLIHSIIYGWFVVVNDTVDQIQSPVFRFTTCHKADLDVDRDVDIMDVSILVYYYGEDLTPGSLPWDVQENGHVDIVDVSALVMYYGEIF
jgi:hypothetical protein